MTKACDQCGDQFEPVRDGHRFCSRRCRVQFHRRATPADADAVVPGINRIAEVTEKELRRLRKLDTVTGQQALIVARRMCSMKDTAASIAAASRELDRLMLRLAAGGAGQPEDQLAAARRRRDEKRRRARTDETSRGATDPGGRT